MWAEKETTYWEMQKSDPGSNLNSFSAVLDIIGFNVFPENL